jgi:hypothetical protein
MTESPVGARGAVGHKCALAVRPPRPVLSNGETAVSLEAAPHTLHERNARSLAVGHRAGHDCILPTGERSVCRLAPGLVGSRVWGGRAALDHERLRPVAFRAYSAQFRGRECGMLIGRRPDRRSPVRRPLGVVPPALANKLTLARVFGSQVVALTAEERAQILAAIEREPRRLDDELRDLILRQTKWRRR